MKELVKKLKWFLKSNNYFTQCTFLLQNDWLTKKSQLKTNLISSCKQAGYKMIKANFYTTALT